jgi:hypothetical protein
VDFNCCCGSFADDAIVLHLLQLICASLTAAAGWCIFKGLCPAEGKAHKGWQHFCCISSLPPNLPGSITAVGAAAVRSIEDCIGISNSAGRAPVIPAKCADRAALLEACLESQQELAKAKTGRCGGAQPIPKPSPAS